MSNIVGEGFPEEIIKQIETRQEKIGSINRDNEILTWLNTRTGWCKLVSSVDLKNPDGTSSIIRELNDPDLASKYVLFNGTTKESPTKGALETYQRGGVWDGINGNSNDYAYGMGDPNYGLRPMPGIISANIKTETRGSIKTAEVKIHANNRQQFDIIDLLYMRLGFSILLEWGNSSYFNNDGTYQPDRDFSLADAFLDPTKTKVKFIDPEKNPATLTYSNYSQIINTKRLESCGNYDAMIGKVVNFSWTFTKDLTYEITLKIISMGDVIESLKANAFLPSTEIINPFLNINWRELQVTEESERNRKINQSSTLSPKDLSLIPSFANAHEIGKMFYKYQQLLEKEDPKALTVSLPSSSPGENGEDESSRIIFFSQKYDGNTPQYYIKLAFFLKWIEQNIILNINIDDNTIESQVKLLKINNKVKENIIYLVGRQISTNPGICIFKSEVKVSNGTVYFAKNADEFYVNDSNLNGTYGYIMNSYFNMSWVLTKLETLKNKEGKISLYDLLNSLCMGWNSATGNINKLEPTINEDNEIIFIDTVTLPDKNYFLNKLGRSTTPGKFNAYGYSNNGKINQSAGFIKDLSFQTTVSPNLATMITVGATSNGYVVGQDSTALSRMNNGLKDRFKPYITTPGNSLNNEPSFKQLFVTYAGPITNYNNFVKELGSFNGTGKPIWNQLYIDAFSTSANSFYEYDQAFQTLTLSREAKKAKLDPKSNKYNASSPNIGFLPFDLSLTMDGLSGMKVYQKYEIDTDYLPSNYPNSLEFIIKGIYNNISNNQWTTTLESMAIPKHPFGSEVGNSAVEQASQNNDKSSVNIIGTKELIPISKQNIVKKIIKFSNDNKIYDIERLTAILAVAQAETRLDPSLTEGYIKHTVSSARKTFPTRLGNKTDKQIADLLVNQTSFYNFVYNNNGINGGGNDGSDYRGRGLSQITGKSNYVAMQKLLDANKKGYNIANNVKNAAVEDISVAILVLGKINGSFGNKLNPGDKKYLTDGKSILQTQNGGGNGSMNVIQNYTNALYAINNTQWIQDLLYNVKGLL